ncbi:hypothetical protein ACFIQG_06485 [Comamonas odontotermitis]
MKTLKSLKYQANPRIFATFAQGLQKGMKLAERMLCEPWNEAV